MRRFTTAILLVAVALSLAGLVRGADGVKAGQKIEVQYVVGAKTVFASATLGPDGTLSFAFPTEDGLRVGWAYYRLVRQDVGPEPDPGPKPQPTPIKRVTDLYVVWETADSTQAEAAIRNNQAWKDEAGKLKIKWGQGDIDNLGKLPKFAAVVAAAKGKLPCVVLVDESGGTKTEPLPKTPAAMLTLVRKAGGQKQ